MQTLLHDLTLAFRQLLKNPGFTAVAVLVLAVGIGACTALFSVANAVLFQPLPYDQPDQPVANVRTMRDVLSVSVAAESFMMMLTGFFAVLALLLAAVAVFGVVSYGVARRTREIGVRLALGAPRAAVLGLVVRQGMVMVWIGLATGLMGTLALSHVLQRLIFEISPTDPPTIATVMLVMTAAALLACLALSPANAAETDSPLPVQGVPAGAFEANHFVLAQKTSADTWLKKRAGHSTDFWVLDNQVIVRIRRHREPYEVELLDFTVPEEVVRRLNSEIRRAEEYLLRAAAGD